MKKFLFILSFIFLFIGCQDKKENEVIPYEITNQEQFGNKLQGDITIDFVDGEMPNIDQMLKVAEKIQKEYPNFENYFLNFQFKFTDESEARNEDNFVSYYLFEKIGNSNFIAIPTYNNITHIKVTLNKQIIGHLGINTIANISPIINGMKLSEVEEKLGKPSSVSNEKEIEYYVVNEKYQMLGILFIQHEDNIIKVANFFPPRLNLNKEELSEIDSYIAGNKKFNDLNIKKLKDIY